MRKIMAALDIGNSSIKLIVAEMTKGNFNILSVSEKETKGYRKNSIISEQELSNAIIDVLRDSESKLNMPISKVLVVLPANNVEFTIGEAKIKTSSGKVSGNDITKVILESYKGVIPDNMELVNVIPMNFKLDSNEVTLKPKNCISTSLRVKSIIIMAPKNNVYKILSILDKLNIDIVDIGIDSIGDYNTFKNDKINKQIGAIVNIGDNKTTISIFNKGIITNSSIVELGGKNIDNDIAYIYRVNLNEAKKLKEEFAYASPKFTSSGNEISIINKDNKKININQNEISKVVYSRLKEIIETVKKEINHLTKKEISYIIFTGGVTEMIDFKLLLEDFMDKNVTLGKINYLGARNNKFSSVIGLIKWYNDMEILKDKDYSIFTIEEQEEFSGVEKQNLNSDNSVISKFFSYFLDD